MPNPRTLTITAVVLATLAAIVAWACSDAQAGVPDPIDGPQPGEGGRAVPAHARGSEEATSVDQPGAVRVEAGDPRDDDDRETELQVLLQVKVDGVLQVAPQVDVALRLPATERGDDEVRAVARTDDNGRATFQLIGATGRRVRLRSGLGGVGGTTITEQERQSIELLVPARMVATGTVVQPGSIAVPYADILLLHWSHHEHDPGQLWYIGKADHQGRFRIPLFAGGRIGAAHPDFGDSPMFLVRAPAPGQAEHTNLDSARLPTQNFELMLAAIRAHLRGVVVDHLGAAVPFARVEARSEHRTPAGAELAGPPRRARCDDAGRFVIDGLGAGAVSWTARARGHGWLDGHRELTAGRDNELRIQLPIPASLTGRVTRSSITRNSATGNSVTGTGDDAPPKRTPVGNALVTVGEQGTLAFTTARTDADGYYELRDLGAGKLRARVHHDLGRARTRVSLQAGVAATWNVTLGGANGSDELQGTVVDEQLQPLREWHVVVRQKGYDPVAGVTDERGRFSLPVNVRERLDVRAYAPGRPLTSFADAMLRDQHADRPVRLVVNTAADVHVTGRIVDASATGVPATIGCWHYQRREYARYTADSDGQFRIPRAQLGTIDLTIEHPGHVTHKSGALAIRRGLPVDLGTVQLALGGGLYGNVVGPGGTPPPECTLTLMQAGDSHELRAQYDGGGYRFTGVPPGTHTLLIKGPNIAGAALPVTIEAGVDAPLDVEVQAGFLKRILVRVPRGGGARVTLAVRGPNGVRWMATANVVRDGNGDGTATFETWMLAGSYELVAATDGNQQATATVTYSANGPTEVTLRTAPR